MSIYVVAEFDDKDRVVIQKDREDKYSYAILSKKKNIDEDTHPWKRKWLLASALTKGGYTKINPVPLQDYIDELNGHFIKL